MPSDLEALDGDVPLGRHGNADVDATRMPFRIGVISDTHGKLSAAVHRIFKGVDLILHAGDIGGDEIIHELNMMAPVVAVSGNVDGAAHPVLRPPTRQLETAAGRIAMTHGHLPYAPANDYEMLVAAFAAFGPEIIIHGHTHKAALSRVGAVMVFNPGAAGRSEPGKPASVGMITVEAAGAAPRLEHIVLVS